MNLKSFLLLFLSFYLLSCNNENKAQKVKEAKDNFLSKIKEEDGFKWKGRLVAYDKLSMSSFYSKFNIFESMQVKSISLGCYTLFKYKENFPEKPNYFEKYFWPFYNKDTLRAFFSAGIYKTKKKEKELFFLKEYEKSLESIDSKISNLIESYNLNVDKASAKKTLKDWSNTYKLSKCSKYSANKYYSFLEEGDCLYMKGMTDLKIDLFEEDGVFSAYFLSGKLLLVRLYSFGVEKSVIDEILKNRINNSFNTKIIRKKLKHDFDSPQFVIEIYANELEEIRSQQHKVCQEASIANFLNERFKAQIEFIKRRKEILDKKIKESGL